MRWRVTWTRRWPVRSRNLAAGSGSNRSAGDLERLDRNGVDVAQAVPRPTQRAHELLVAHGPRGRLRQAAARAGEEERPAVRRDTRVEVPGLGIDPVTERTRGRPHAVAPGADVEVEPALAVGATARAEDQVALVGRDPGLDLPELRVDRVAEVDGRRVAPALEAG